MAAIPKGIWSVAAGVVPGGAARGLIMHGVLRYTGTAPASVLTFGDGGAVRNGETLWTGLDVVRATQAGWSSEADIGILLRNFDASWIEVRRAQHCKHRHQRPIRFLAHLRASQLRRRP